jgi:two-component system KDP operon response regulator KdpE
MDAIKILVIDPEPSLCKDAISLFPNGNYTVFCAETGQEGLRQLYSVQPQLVLLDLYVPGMNGIEVLKRLRELTDVPVIMLSKAMQTSLIVRALELGADDFIQKPFDGEELHARVHALLRRASTGATGPLEPHYFDGYLTMDLAGNRVWVNNQPIRLTVTEYRFLEYLFLHSGKVCTYSQILENVWGGVTPGRFQYLHVYMWKLRSKLEKDPEHPQYLLTEHGYGYRFAKQKY